MLNYIVILICFLLGLVISFLCGYLTAKLSQKFNKEDKLSYVLEQFKNEIKNLAQKNDINTHEFKNMLYETAKLAKSLTTNQNLKGNFGEDCLEAVLRACFPNKNINYIKQLETYNEENKKIKPDYVVYLPNNKSIIIDCKLNLEKFIEFSNASDEYKIDKKNELIKDLNSTINNLSNKKYESAISLEQCDFILMYIPLESLISYIYTDGDFISVIKNAQEKNIIIVGNSSIITIIRLVSTLWANYAQEKNIDKIINTAGEIYNLLALHSINLSNMKNTLNNLNDTFNKEFDKLQSDNKLFCAAEELRNYGIQAQNKKQGKKLNEIKIDEAFLK